MLKNRIKHKIENGDIEKIKIIYFSILIIYLIFITLLTNGLINLIEYGVITTFNSIKGGYIPSFKLSKIIFSINRNKPYSYLYIITLTLFLGIGIKYTYKINRSYKSLNKGQHGDSRFTTIKEIQNQYKEVPQKTKEYQGDGGVVISRYKDKIYIDDGPVNNLIIGTTRSGKGENFIFPTIDVLSRAENKPSMVFNDPKGELVSSSYDTLKKRGYNIEILNILEPERGMNYNPLQLIIEAYKNGDQKEAVSLCNTLTYSIFKSEENNTSDTFWSDASISLVNACILAVTEECIKNNEEHKITMFTVANLLNEMSAPAQDVDIDFDERSLSKLDKYFDTFSPSSPARLQYSTFKFTEGKTRASVLATAMSKLQIFTFPDIAKMTSKHSYEFKNVGFNTQNRYNLLLNIKDTELNKVIDEKEINLKYVPRDGMYSKKEDLEKLKDYLEREENQNLKIEYRVDKEIIQPLFTTDNISAEMLKKYNWDYIKTKSILNGLYNKGFISDPRYTSIYLKDHNKGQFKDILEKLKMDSKYKVWVEKILSDIPQISYTDDYSENSISPMFIRENTNAIGLHPISNFTNNGLLSEEEKIIMNIITERFLEFLDKPSEILTLKITIDNSLKFEYMKTFKLNEKDLPKNLYLHLLNIEDTEKKEIGKQKILEENKKALEELLGGSKVKSKQGTEETIEDNPDMVEMHNKKIDLVKLKDILGDRKIIKENIKVNKDNITYIINEEFKNAPVAIFMVTPDFDRSKHVLASMFTRQLYYVLIKESNLSDKQKTDRTVHFILDEFGAMPRIEAMDNLITVCLSRNIRFSLVIQSYSQLEERYGSAGNTIKENCGNTIYILTTDYETADDISKKCGNKTLYDYTRTGKHLSVDKTENESVKQERLILPDNLIRLEQDNTIVLRPIKRTDLKGNKIVPYAIYNTGELAMIPRWKYLLDDFPQGININEIINKAYKDKVQVDLNDLIYLPKL